MCSPLAFLIAAGGGGRAAPLASTALSQPAALGPKLDSAPPRWPEIGALQALEFLGIIGNLIDVLIFTGLFDGILGS